MPPIEPDDSIGGIILLKGGTLRCLSVSSYQEASNYGMISFRLETYHSIIWKQKFTHYAANSLSLRSRDLASLLQY